MYDIERDFRKLWRTNLRYGASLRVVKRSLYWEVFLRHRGTGFWFGRPVKEGLLALCLSLMLKGVQAIGYYLYREKGETRRGRPMPSPPSGLPQDIKA